MSKVKVAIHAKDSDKEVIYSPKENLVDIYVGKNPDNYKLRKVASSAPWKDIAATELNIVSGDLSAEQLETIYEVIELKSFIFDKYKAKPRNQIKTVTIKRNAKTLKFPERRKLIETIKYCRDIVSSNASEVNAGFMEREAKALARKSKNIKVKVINATEARKLGMGCLLAVGAESLANSEEDFHPRLVLLEYDANPTKKNKKHIALVGKGITFDTGGLCLKPSDYMLDMKSDMTGSATVLSVFRAMSQLGRFNPNIKVTGVMALAENAFGASSYKPGDVLSAMNGKTVQVVDTDAEGRLVLADALSYVSANDSVTEIIDLATLTGSIVATLGEVAAGAMTNNQELLDRVRAAFDSEGENLWQMPLLDEYKSLLKSNIADMAHCSKRPDALVAGLFLREFVREKAWLHLDIAGMGFWERDGIWAYKGATGFAIKGLIRYLKSVK